MASNPILICDVSHSFFSIARYSGGARIQGEEYVYCQKKDILVKRDWYKHYQRLPWSEFLAAVKVGEKPELPKRKQKKKSKQQDKTTQSLFD